MSHSLLLFFWLVDGLSSHESHRCVASRCCVTVTRNAQCMQADGSMRWAGGHASSGDVRVCSSLNLHVGDLCRSGSAGERLSVPGKSSRLMA